MPTDPTYFYTFEDIQRYLSGSMATSEMHEMEKAALNDPLLADALDGYRGAQPAVTLQHLNEIKSRIAAVKTETRPTPVITLHTPKNKWWRGLSAAVLIGLMFLGGWLFLKPTQQKGTLPAVAQQTATAAPPTSEATIPVKPDSAAIPEKLPPPVISKKEMLKNRTASPAAPPAVMQPNPEPLADNTVAAAPVTIDQPKETASLQSQNDPVVTALGLRRNYSHGRSNLLPGGAPPQFFSGKVLDPKGRPIPGASITAAPNNGTLSNTDGSFRLPASDSTGTVTVTAVGYTARAEQMTAGKVLNVKLDESQNALNDVVVIGYGTQKKKSITGALAGIKVDTLPYKESPYPLGGWDLFYNNLTTEMGVNSATADKELHLLFDVEEGIPKNFIVIKTPDAVTAEKAISIIKKGPRWNVFKRRKKVDLKLKVD
ncbi:MAG: carboxypeptidase-like regulatory domain-containing protein [Niabella sp.]|nr:carboxypeptidase-like regulatory domain-containing protein [Niabella sp.]